MKRRHTVGKLIEDDRVLAPVLVLVAHARDARESVDLVYRHRASDIFSFRIV